MSGFFHHFFGFFFIYFLHLIFLFSVIILLCLHDTELNKSHIFILLFFINNFLSIFHSFFFSFKDRMRYKEIALEKEKEREFFCEFSIFIFFIIKFHFYYHIIISYFYIFFYFLIAKNSKLWRNNPMKCILHMCVCVICCVLHHIIIMSCRELFFFSFSNFRLIEDNFK